MAEGAGMGGIYSVDGILLVPQMAGWLYKK
jgi:hypothetical protein